MLGRLPWDFANSHQLFATLDIGDDGDSRPKIPLPYMRANGGGGGEALKEP